jgi:YebC/PmpR family DNA-binding regulatory protein
MSGHSHAKTIRHQKNLTDQKKGKMFSKMARVILVAVKKGGTDPDTNSQLRLAIETAKKVNMPKENVERAIKRGTNEPAGETLEEVSFEAFGPFGIALVIEGITDNKNRTLLEIKQVLNQSGGKLVDAGSVKWLFERKGRLTLDLNSQEESFKNREKLEMLAIEFGAEDFSWYDGNLDIYTKIEDLDKIKRGIEENGAKVESASLDWVAKEEIQVDKGIKEICQKLFELLDESDSVQEIYSNLKI